MYIRNNKTYLTQYDLKDAINQIISFIKSLERNNSIHLIGLARGSFNLIQELSNKCNLPYTILQYSTYDKDDKEVKFGFSSEDIQPDDMLLIVDDIVDTGNSIIKTIEYLKIILRKPKIEVYSVVGNKTKFPNWNYYIDNEFNNWIVFPYENMEYKEICKECELGIPCNKYEYKIHCTQFNKSFFNCHSCKDFI